MKLHSQYLKLHSRYGGHAEAAVTLDELALTLGCTHRNALHVVNKMVQQGWISWISSRGRGRKSMLGFLIPSEEIALQSMKQAISRKDILSSIEGIRTHAKSSSLQDTLQGWLLTYFGHHAEIHSDKQIDTLRLPVTQQLHTFDPLYMNLLAESFVSSHVFDGLVKRSGEKKEIGPGLAHAWEADLSRTVWTFYLRKEVLFHHGKVLTAEDVVYTFERLMTTSQRILYNYIFKDIQSVTALSPTTVRIQLKKPNELFLPFLCTSRAAIVPRDWEETRGTDPGRLPAGTGPFKITEIHDQLCVLEVFPYYFQGRAHLDRVEILYVPWDTGASAAEGGPAFHVIQNPAAGGDTKWSRMHSGSSTLKFVTFNTHKKGPLNDSAYRASLIACLKDKPRKPIATEPGQQPSSPLQIATIPQYAADAESIRGKLTDAGLPCKVVTVSLEEFKGSIRLESDLIVFSLFRDQDEQLRLFDLYQTLARHIEPHTRGVIENSLHTISREPDPLIRAERLQRIENLLISDHHLHILYEKPTQTAYLPSVRGVTFNSQGWVDLRHIWFPPEN